MLVSRICSRLILALATVATLGVSQDVEAQAAGVLQAEVQVVDLRAGEAGLQATRLALGVPRPGDLVAIRERYPLPVVRKVTHEGERRSSGAAPSRRVVVLVLYLR